MVYLKMKLSAYFIFFNLLISLIFFSITPHKAFAATIFYDTPAPSGSNFEVVDASFCGVAAECANTDSTSTNNSACSLSGCGGGLTWTKYQLTCIYDAERQDYKGYYQQLGDRVYSIGDKCMGNETGLRPGFCGGSYGVIYKRCCSGSNPTACTLAPASLQDGIDPNEGTCPDGTYETPAGTTSCPASYVEPPPAPVEPNCSDGIQNGDETGTDCGGSSLPK